MVSFVVRGPDCNALTFPKGLRYTHSSKAGVTTRPSKLMYQRCRSHLSGRTLALTSVLDLPAWLRSCCKASRLSPDDVPVLTRTNTTDVDIGQTTVRWQKGFSDVDYVRRSEGGSVLALSAFYLSTLPTPLARKAAVKEMWKSGAGTIVSVAFFGTHG